MPLHLFDSVDRFGRPQRGAVALLRERLGDPLPFEIEDSAILNAINAAIVEYSRLRPRVLEVDLRITAGQEYYVLSDSLVKEKPVEEEETGQPPTGSVIEPIPPISTDSTPELFGCLTEGVDIILDVVDCVFSFQEVDSDDMLEGFIPNSYRKGNSPYSYIRLSERMPYPSEMLIESMYSDTHGRYEGSEWKYFPDNDTLRVIPAPTVSGITKATLAYVHSPNSISDKDVETVLLYAQAEALETLANFRSKVKSLPTGVGYKMTLDGGERLYALAEKKRKEFYSRFYTGGSHHTTG